MKTVMYTRLEMSCKRRILVHPLDEDGKLDIEVWGKQGQAISYARNYDTTEDISPAIWGLE